LTYYDLSFDGYDSKRWVVSIPPIHPGETEWWDVWAFARCEPYDGPTPIQGEEFDGPGKRTAFTSCSFSSYVVSKKLGDAMLSVAPTQLQLIPMVIDDEPAGEWFILNILKQVDCMDLDRSKVDRGVRDGVEKILSVYYLEIDEEKAAGHDIFRLGEFSVQVLISETMATAMLESGESGFVLQPLPWSFLHGKQGLRGGS